MTQGQATDQVNEVTNQAVNQTANNVVNQDRVYFFDTTLRDGEQSPGVSLQTPEKIEIAQNLVRLGIDVIEAGFPAASPGDFFFLYAVLLCAAAFISTAVPGNGPVLII